MTGYGQAEFHRDDVSFSVEIRSVNHRFLDVHVRCSGKFASWETPVRGMVREALKRGKVDVHLSVRESGRFSGKLSINRSMVKAFLEETDRVREEFGIGGEVTVRDLIGVPGLFETAQEGEDPVNLLWPEAEDTVRKALAMLIEARKMEGELLKNIMRETTQRIEAITGHIRSFMAENRKAAQARFKERIGALSGNAGVDPARLHQEAAILVDRLDITEECDRLGSHLASMETLFRSPGGAVGKRFDFLVQEVFRELNTAGNKSAHAGISSLVVEAKTELEKIREQIQNVE
ncbi:MAG: YicC family protein [Syntrophorhabdaceae bacterium]|nr:YicC family protein [Syntrophorhabdaceae bacterium]